MVEDIGVEFEDLLNAVGSEKTYKILKLYSKRKDGLNLTDTSRKISEITSTIRDHLKKMLETGLIFKEDKKYFLSNFGSFVLSSLEEFRTFNKFRSIFGQIPGEIIPSRFLREFIPHIKNLHVITNQWQFLNVTNEVIENIKSDIDTKKVEMKILGWKSLTLMLDIFQNYFKELSSSPDSIQKLLDTFDFQLISNMDILEELKKSTQVKDLMKLTNLQKHIHICKEIDNFNFVLFKYNNNVHIFLNKNNRFNFENYFLAQDNLGVVEFYNKVFRYYLDRSIPLSEYIGKSGDY